MQNSDLRTLRAQSIIKTAETLRRRIEERFPKRNLKHVAEEVVAIAKEARQRIEDYSQPNYWLRSLVLLALLFFVLGIIIAIRQLSFDIGLLSLLDVIAALESGINDALFLGAAVFFFITLEQRLKQRKIKAAMQELRVLAHVVDAHQLTKDSQRIGHGGPDTASSPKDRMTAFELTRYLDYCSEMLSLIGKLGALYAQSDDSDSTIAGVNEIEQLTSGLSAKIWQKMMTVYQVTGNNSAESPLLTSPLKESTVKPTATQQPDSPKPVVITPLDTALENREIPEEADALTRNDSTTID